MKRKHIVDIVFALLLTLTFCGLAAEVNALFENYDITKYILPFLPLYYLSLVIAEIELWCQLRYFTLEASEQTAVKTAFHLIFLFALFFGTVLYAETQYVVNLLTRWIGFSAVKRLFRGVVLLWFVAKVVYLIYLGFGDAVSSDDDSSVSCICVTENTVE